MDSEPHDVEKQASAIAHEFFWCVAGRHQACTEQLQNTSGAVPDAVWWSLCFEPLLFGLSLFGKYARRHRDDRRSLAETKEQLGGIHILEARDLNHAIQLISQHPGMKCGTIDSHPPGQ